MGLFKGTVSPYPTGGTIAQLQFEHTVSVHVDDRERLDVKLVFGWALSHVMYSNVN